MINELLSGVVIFRTGKEQICYKPPSAEDKSFADFLSNEVYENLIFDGVWNSRDAEEFLKSQGFWSDEQEKQIEVISGNIDNMKLDYFNNFVSPDTKRYIRLNIDKMFEKMMGLYSKKNALFDKTAEYAKSYKYTSFLIEKNCYMENGELARDYVGVDLLFRKVNERLNAIGNNLRSVAKSVEWRNLWIPCKDRVFENKISSLTEVQAGIISWSHYYDSINESHERPSQAIIDDDYALDGWAIKQKRKREEEDKKKNAESMLPSKAQNAGEVFIPVKNKEEIKNVMSLNDGYGKNKINMLNKDLKTKGSVEDSQLTSTRLEVQMASAKMTRS